MRSLVPVLALILALSGATAPVAADGREVVVRSPLPLGAGGGVTLRFESGKRLELIRDRRGDFRGRLSPLLLRQTFELLRQPGDQPEVHARGGGVPPRSLVRGEGPAWLFPAGWQGAQLPAFPFRSGLHQDHLVPLPGQGLPRPLRVHLPRAYLAGGERRFPVVYVLDGQNAFDASTSYGGSEWNLDEIQQVLEAEGVEPFVMVGIDNGLARRLHEYTFVADPEHGGGGSEEHLALLLGPVESFLASRYRLDTSRRYLVGSSLGGLFGLHACLTRGEDFRGVAALSPSIWWSGEAILRVPRQGPRPRLWTDMGTREGDASEAQYAKLRERLATLGWRSGHDLAGQVVPGARHTESAWASRVGDALRFLLGSTP